MANIELKKRFRESPAIKYYQRIAWTLPIIIVILSVLLSIHRSSWEFFSRAGCLIVLVGVYIAYKDWSGEIYQTIKPDYFTMSELMEFVSCDVLDESERKDLAITCKNIERVHNENKSFVRYASKRFRKMEAVLLFIGTLVWGYGDLLLNLIYHLNA